MFTHLSVSRADAEKVHAELAWKAWNQRGRNGSTTLETLDLHFAKFSMAHLWGLADGATLSRDRPGSELFVIAVRDYLPHMPQQLIDLKVEVVGAEIVRHNSAPTQARAGYYESLEKSLTATVERTAPSGNNIAHIGVYVQQIRVGGPSLAAVQEYNTKLSQGGYNDLLVNAFE